MTEVNNNNTLSWKREYLDMVMVYALLFVSGSQLYDLSPNKNLIIMFVISVIAWLVLSDRKIDTRFVLYLCLFSGILVIIHLYTNNSLSFPSVIGTILKLIIAYLILKIVGNNFVESYIKVIVFLAVISLFGYMTDKYSLFDGLISHLPHVGKSSYEGIFYVFRYRAHIDRNNSIFFEPGAYQIFLNVALFMLFFAPTYFNNRKKWVFISILFITLITTFSTTGYLIFSATFALFLIKSKILSANRKVILVAVLSVLAIVFATQFRQVIVDKIDKFLAIQDITDKQDRRSFDTLVDIQIFKNNILGVGYDKYFIEFNRIGKITLGNASSNGLTKTLAVYGLPFFIIFYGSIFLFFIKYYPGILMRIVPFAMVLVSHFGEAYYVFTPFSLALIASIFTYNSLRRENSSLNKEKKKLS